MAERYQSSDVPAYPTYPAEPPVESAHIDRNTVSLPRQNNADLEDAARKIGGSIGRIVASLQERGEEAQSRAADLSDKAGREYRKYMERGEQQAREFGEKAADVMDRASREAREKLASLRAEAAGYTRKARQDYPVELIIAAGAAGLAAGIGLRMWRVNRG
jgi:hypothetical protein